MTEQNNKTAMGIAEGPLADEQFISKIQKRLNAEKIKISSLQETAKYLNIKGTEFNTLKQLHSELELLVAHIQTNYNTYQALEKKAPIEKKALRYCENILISQKANLYTHNIAKMFTQKIEKIRNYSDSPVLNICLFIQVKKDCMTCDAFEVVDPTKEIENAIQNPYTHFSFKREKNDLIYKFIEQGMELLDNFEKRRALALAIAIEVCQKLNRNEFTCNTELSDYEFNNVELSPETPAFIAIVYSAANPKYQPDCLQSWGI